MRKISVTIDERLLDQLHAQEGRDVNVSAAINEALARRNKQNGLRAWLDEWDRKAPISPEGRAAGEALWQQIVSSSIPEPSPPSRKVAKRSASSRKGH